MAARASLIDKETASSLNFIIRGRPLRWHAIEQVRIREPFRYVLRKAVKIGIRPLITRHLTVRQITLWIAQPSDQPVWVHFTSDFSQFRPYIASNQARRAGSRCREGG